jgi:hypothetical protein
VRFIFCLELVFVGSFAGVGAKRCGFGLLGAANIYPERVELLSGYDI